MKESVSLIEDVSALQYNSYDDFMNITRHNYVTVIRISLIM